MKTRVVGHITKVVHKFTSTRGVVLFKVKGQEKVHSAIGEFPEDAENVPMELYGAWGEYKGQAQFQVEFACRVTPETLIGMDKYLSAAMPGVGPARAREIVAKFGSDLHKILEREPLRLIEIKGIGPETANRIHRIYQEDVLLRKVSQFLAGIDVDVSWAIKIIRALGNGCIETISKNPYRLTAVSGIGFEKADAIALKLGWGLDSLDRAEGILGYMFEDAGLNGHCFLPRVELLNNCAKYGVGEELSIPALERMLANRHLVLQTVTRPQMDPIDLIYLPRMYNVEVSLAGRIRALLETKPSVKHSRENMAWIVSQSESALNLTLTDEQRSAVLNALFEPISILTGGPGTGKTASLRALIHAVKKLGYKMSLCAPTGRAAKHMATITEEKAFTIHRLLKYDGESGTWGHNSENKLDTDIVICDEFSMVDVELAFRVFDAVRVGTPILIVGDKDQLPAVSPGKVLDDLILSRKIPVTKLTKIFRQAQESLIVQNAHRILNGEPPQFPHKQEGAEMVDMYLLQPPLLTDDDGKSREDYDWIRRVLIKTVSDRIPARMNLDPIRDIQVLSPMRKHDCGVNDLNNVLQDALNPMTPVKQEVEIGQKKFRIGDRVIQHKNNYALEVFNGDIGFVRSIDITKMTLGIDFDGDMKDIPFEDASRELTLAYCMSVHKSQGGEFPAVVVVMLGRHSFMLQRNLVYTATTRAKKLLVYMGTSAIVARAAKHQTNNKRYTYLAQRLKQTKVAEAKAA